MKVKEPNLQSQSDPTPQASAEKLKEDLRNLAQTLEDLLAVTANETSSEFQDLRERARARLAEARSRLTDRGSELYQQASETLRNAYNEFFVYPTEEKNPVKKEKTTQKKQKYK